MEQKADILRRNISAITKKGKNSQCPFFFHDVPIIAKHFHLIHGAANSLNYKTLENPGGKKEGETHEVFFLIQNISIYSTTAFKIGW